MSDVYKISQALEDMKNHYGLKKIKHVILNMTDEDDAHITFVSNRPNLELFNTHDKHTLPEELTYKLSLSILADAKLIGSLYPEED